MTKQPAVYILASRRNGTLYTGVTGDLIRRVWEHRSGLVEGFTKRYGVHRLVYFEVHDHIDEDASPPVIPAEAAIHRGKRYAPPTTTDLSDYL